MKTKAVFFVSVIRPLDKNVTSTYIMTTSLLNGIKENEKKIVFFAICEHEDEMEGVSKYYSKYVDKVIPLHSSFGYDIGKYKTLGKLLFRSCFINYYKKEIRKIISNLDYEPELIISHSPSFESICYSRILKDYYPRVKYYQYWSDPMALSGITPEKMNYKRLPFRFIESKALKYADMIIYGTRTLMFFQKEIYSNYSAKMSYIDIPYVKKDEVKKSVMPKSILYAGNYHKKIRSIEPLIDAVESMDGYRLDVYGDGEIEKRRLKNTFIHGRISADELSKIEGQYEYLACVLNHSCIQIPGKIFYDMRRDVKILILADGKYKKEICNYLKSYNRFVVCDNNSKDIHNSIVSSADKQIDLKRVCNAFSPQRICCDLLNGGKTIER